MKIKYILLALSLLLLASCVKEQLDTPPGPQHPDTFPGFRATLASDTGFAAGDAIGLYMLRGGVILTGGNNIPADNRRYIVRADSTLAPAAAAQQIDFPSNGLPVDFIAYWPYVAQLTDGRYYPLNDSIDLLRAERPGVARGTTDIALTFDHALARLTLQVNVGPAVENPAPKAIKAIIDSLPDGKLNMFADTIALAVGDTTRMRGIRPTAADTAFTTLVVPHAKRNNRNVVFTMSGKNYRWRIPVDSTFVAGKHYLYTLRLTKDAQVEVTSGAIVGWEGSGDPATPVTPH